MKRAEPTVAHPTSLGLEEFARLVAPDAAPPAGVARIRGATHHSGRVRPGDAFFALSGASGHGLEFADEALEAGAAIVVSDRPHRRGIVVGDPAAVLLRLGAWARGRLRRPVVGITGSAGKTTAKALMAAALGGDASPGNMNTPHALAGTLTRAWADGTAAPLVLELGIDHVGEMEALATLVRPDLAVLTRIGASHLDGLGDLATIAREKGRLLADAPRAAAAAEAWSRLSEGLRNRSLCYGLAEDGIDWSGRIVGTAFAPRLQVTAPLELEVDLPGIGRGVAESALGALAVASLLNIPAADAAARLVRARLESGRLQVHRKGARIILDDSYNSNPASAAHALEVLRAAPGPRVAILGDMLELGRESAQHHLALGEATRGLDLVVAVGPAARAIAAGNPAARVLEASDAMAALADLPPRGTILLKASRGMRFERLVRTLLEQDDAGGHPGGGASG